MPSREKQPSHRRDSGHLNGQDFIRGNCMTCDTPIRWPKSVSVWRCIVCATVHDLVPLDGEIRRREASSRRVASPGTASASSSAKQTDILTAPVISLEYTKSLVRECLETYLDSQMYLNDDESYVWRQASSKEIADGQPAFYEARPETTDNPDTYVPQFSFGEVPTLRLNPLHSTKTKRQSSSALKSDVPAEEKTVPQSHQSRFSKRGSVAFRPVFKPLEDYILNCFNHFDCINSAFSRNQRQRRRSGTEPTRKKQAQPRDSRASRQPPRDVSPDKPAIDASICHIDSKTLWLGGVAENGSWWMGTQPDVPGHRTPSTATAGNHPPIPVSSKALDMHWEDLSSWYSTVINAAQGWMEVYKELSADPQSAMLDEQSLQAVEKGLLAGQEQVQRVLLKASEVLLKRPGRTTETPEELRYIFIILENPLLNPGTRHFQGFLQSEKSEPVTPHGGISSTSLLSGAHSGIVKRLAGLLSNVSASCNSQLIVWLAKYPPARFIIAKELISGFLAYRILRASTKTAPQNVDVIAGLIPVMSVGRSAAHIHDEIRGAASLGGPKDTPAKGAYTEDWQILAAARALLLFFSANNLSSARKGDDGLGYGGTLMPNARQGSSHGRIVPASDFYISVIDSMDIINDFELWEQKKARFTFCQFPFLLGVWAKKQILEHDARRQMNTKARHAWIDSIMHHREISQYFNLRVRRDCLVDDSLQAVSEVMGSGAAGDVKKALRIDFKGEEGIDGGGLRKEWFLLLTREVFNPEHGLFSYDEDSQYCYFNPNAFETSAEFFLVGVVVGLAIYNSTILDVALPPFAFRKLLDSIPAHGVGSSAQPKPPMRYGLEDLAEYRPSVANSLRQILLYDGDVEDLSLTFVASTERYGSTVTVPLVPGGEHKPVTNANRKDFIDLYVRYHLDVSVARQFEPFKRGFYSVCGGNAFSLFRPDEIELLVRGSGGALDIPSFRAVAIYSGWVNKSPDGSEPVVSWFWETFQRAPEVDQRKLLSFITGTDRVSALDFQSTPIKLSCLGDDCERFPVARTCFNMLSLYKYASREKLEEKLWRAVRESEGFGLQ